jgi:hypothetical protein
MRAAMLAGVLVALASSAGCGGGAGGDHDSGPGGGGMDAFVVGRPDVGAGIDGGCTPIFEICGDHIDQNCDGHDESCGDNDGDHFEACRPTDVDLTMCDCDDTRADTHPGRGTVPGAPELCDDYDNDCDGRIDESAMCCTGCTSMGIDPTRADNCTVDGQCDCLGEPGVGACAAGETCCDTGCVDTTSDFDNCGACHAQCDHSADRCTGSSCLCGTGSPCDGTQVCTSGACG